MSLPSQKAPPYRVVYSGLCREGMRRLLARAGAKGRLTEIAKVVRGIDTRLRWIPLDLGEPLKDYMHLGIKEHIGVLAPLVVRYGVDEARRIVYVTRPFDLFSGSAF